MTLTFEWEPLARLLNDGGAAMALDNYNEIELNRDAIPLDIDWGYYAHLEQVGTYRILAARRNGRLVGYNSFHLNRHIRHRGTIFAVGDVLYLLPEERRGMAGVRFLRETERLLKEAGVKKAEYGIKVHHRVGASGGTVGDLLEHLGYVHIENTYSKIL